MVKLTVLDWIAAILVVVGALNWGLVGIFHFDLVAAILGDMTMLSRIVYSLVGVSAIWMIYLLMRLSSRS